MNPETYTRTIARQRAKRMQYEAREALIMMGVYFVMVVVMLGVLVFVMEGLR